MSRVALGLWSLALLGCAAAPAAPIASTVAATGAAAKAAAPDPVLALLADLPAGADRCVVARLSRVDPARRALVQRVSQAESIAWLAELEVSAYASVELTERTGPSARVTVLVSALPVERARAVLEAKSSDRIDWSPQPAPCVDAGCPLRARVVGPHALRIERGVIAAARAPGVEAACAQAAQADPLALEVSAMREADALALDQSWLPSFTTNAIHAVDAGLRVHRVDRWPSAVEAEAAFEEQATAGLLLGTSLAGLGEVRRERRGDALHTEIDIAWQDLVFARDDDARMRAADEAADALVRARPNTDAGESDRDALLNAVGYWVDDARRSAGAERARDLDTARGLLERALARAPDDDGLLLLLCELLVGELRDAGAATELLQRASAARVVNPRLSMCGRHAAALASAEALAKQLVADGIAPRRTALTSAREITTRMQSGEAYESAEQGVIAAPRNR